MRGAQLGNITPDHPLHGSIEGIEVIDVDRGSPAWAAGLRADDIIISVNRQPVRNPEEFRSVAESSRDVLLLNICRDGTALFVAID